MSASNAQRKKDSISRVPAAGTLAMRAGIEYPMSKGALLGTLAMRGIARRESTGSTGVECRIGDGGGSERRFCKVW